MTSTAAHATAPQTAGPAFAAVIFNVDDVLTDTAGLHAATANSRSSPNRSQPAV